MLQYPIPSTVVTSIDLLPREVVHELNLQVQAFAYCFRIRHVEAMRFSLEDMELMLDTQLFQMCCQLLCLVSVGVARPVIYVAGRHSKGHILDYVAVSNCRIRLIQLRDTQIGSRAFISAEVHHGIAIFGPAHARIVQDCAVECNRTDILWYQHLRDADPAGAVAVDLRHDEHAGDVATGTSASKAHVVLSMPHFEAPSSAMNFIASASWMTGAG